MNEEFIGALREIVREKGVSEDLLFTAIEDALVSAYKKNYYKTANGAHNVKVTIDRENGEIHVYSQKKIVEEVFNETIEISLDEAREIDPRYEVNDIVDIEVTPREFGRVAAQSAKQVVIQRIKEAERNVIYNDFLEKEYDIITGTVIRKDRGNVFIDLGKLEAILGQNEQIATERYDFNQRIKLYIVEVKKTTKGPQIIVSRTHPGLVKRLFELEVPEIFSGVVEIKGISREAGSRSKVSVHSNDEDVDPMGACVGPKGSRVQNIVDELNNEKIDIIKWSKNPEEFISNSLSPAKVFKVSIIDEANKCARAVVDDNQLSLAIGKEGQNVRLAAKLTGWKIDIKSKSQMDRIKDTIEDDIKNDIVEDINIDEDIKEDEDISIDEDIKEDEDINIDELLQEILDD
jgi:N utilization substance protein A